MRQPPTVRPQTDEQERDIALIRGIAEIRVDARPQFARVPLAQCRRTSGNLHKGFSTLQRGHDGAKFFVYPLEQSRAARVLREARPPRDLMTECDERRNLHPSSR